MSLRPIPAQHLIDAGTCPSCGQELNNEAKLREMAAANIRLREKLGEAWMIGSTHNKPTFEQLNAWHAMLNKK